MKELLEEIFGKALIQYREKEVRLPLYLKDGRSFFDVEICSQQFVLVTLPLENRFNIETLKKQSAIYRSKFQRPISYGFERITAFQRKSMIENQLPFIAANRQIFLPFIGTYFSKCEVKQLSTQGIHFTPATQMVFLLILYSADSLWINKGQAAKALGITPMSVSRATQQLKKLGIIEEKNVGTEIRIHRILPRVEAYSTASNYLLNPIRKILYVSNDSMSESEITAGEYALASRSELGYPRYREFAINKKTAESNEWEICDPDLIMENAAIKMQIWKYAPELFARNDTVDPVSLLCSFDRNQDERIHKCLENIKEEIDVWQIEI